MKGFLKSIVSGKELVGTCNLLAGIAMVLLWSYFTPEWWSAVLGFLALFFLIEAIWHYIFADYIEYKK
jgi:hypothetical protein